MIKGGSRYVVGNPVLCSGSREKVSHALTGTTWVVIKTFDEFTVLTEIIAIVPALAGGVETVEIGLFDADLLTDGQERWNSGDLAENAVTNLGLDRVVVPGNVLMIKESAAGTETVELVLYKMGI